MRKTLLLFGFALGMLAVLGTSCEELKKQGGEGQGDMNDIEFVRPVKDSQPAIEGDDFTEDSQGTPIEGKQVAPKDGLIHESTTEEAELWY